jgi:hypothetical protein
MTMLLFKIEIDPVSNSLWLISVHIVNCPKSEQRQKRSQCLPRGDDVTGPRLIRVQTHVFQIHFIQEINANIYTKYNHSTV